jgi:hypothetical protein
VDKAENTNHQFEMHQETYMPASFSVLGDVNYCKQMPKRGKPTRCLQIETDNFSVKREKNCLRSVPIQPLQWMDAFANSCRIYKARFRYVVSY